MPKRSERAMWASHLKAGGKARGAPAPPPAGLAKEAFQGRILGIDPSLRGTGLAILDFSPPQNGRWLAGETVRPPSGASLPECLGVIARAVERCIGDWSPDVVAIEETIYVQNFRTAQKLGAARGAAIGCAALRGIPVFEYPPLRIKQAVVGYGRASKEQVARQMSVLLGLERQLAFDEADAAATAFCHAMTLGRTGGVFR